jgi:hypothetical protein
MMVIAGISLFLGALAVGFIKEHTPQADDSAAVK